MRDSRSASLQGLPDLEGPAVAFYVFFNEEPKIFVSSSRITWRPNSARSTPLVLCFVLGGKCSDLKDSCMLSFFACTHPGASLLPAVSHHTCIDHVI